MVLVDLNNGFKIFENEILNELEFKLEFENENENVENENINCDFDFYDNGPLCPTTAPTPTPSPTPPPRPPIFYLIDNGIRLCENNILECIFDITHGEYGLFIGENNSEKFYDNGYYCQPYPTPAPTPAPTPRPPIVLLIFVGYGIVLFIGYDLCEILKEYKLENENVRNVNCGAVGVGSLQDEAVEQEGKETEGGEEGEQIGMFYFCGYFILAR